MSSRRDLATRDDSPERRLARRDNFLPQKYVLNELAQDNLRRQIRRDAVEHPLTVYPLTVALLAGFYLVFVAPFLGGGIFVVGSAIGFAVFGVTCCGWRWFIRGKRFLKEKGQELLSLQAQAEEAELNDEIDNQRFWLEKGLKLAGWQDGLKELAELSGAYEDLVACLRHHGESEVISVQQISRLAVNTYKQGLAVLATALEIMRGVDSGDIANLEAEIAKIESDIQRLQQVSPQDPKIEIKNTTLASHKELLEKMKGQQLYLEKLLAQLDKCEDALCQTRLDMNVLSIEQAEGQGQAVVERLQKVIALAKEVQDELKRMEGLNV